MKNNVDVSLIESIYCYIDIFFLRNVELIKNRVSIKVSINYCLCMLDVWKKWIIFFVWVYECDIVMINL